MKSRRQIAIPLLAALLISTQGTWKKACADEKFKNYVAVNRALELTIKQWMERAETTREERIRHVFGSVSQSEIRSKMALHIADLYLGKNRDETNRILLRLFTSADMQLRSAYRLEDKWDLVLTKQLYYLYYWFGTKSKLFPGRITPEVERALLEELWHRMQDKDDIHIAHQSTWWMVGSENHDVVSKVSALISSQIFKNAPEFADRVYRDRGTGAGQGYWFHNMYGGATIEGPSGNGSKTIRKPQTAKDHYLAWIDFFDEYFTERARKGFFLEHASTGYMGVTLTYLLDVYQLCEDEALREKVRMFQDLVWCEWAQDALYGVKGGSRTRGDFDVWQDAMYKMSSFTFWGRL